MTNGKLLYFLSFRALHKVVCLGKRPLSYAIAKRIAALNSLDLKDSDGMVQYTHTHTYTHMSE